MAKRITTGRDEPDACGERALGASTNRASVEQDVDRTARAAKQLRCLEKLEVHADVTMLARAGMWR
jgi:hypothetical protein